MENENKNFERIRLEIDLVKQRFENIDHILKAQEEMLNHLAENTRSLLKDIFSSNKDNSIEGIMKRAFSNKQVPKILR